MYITFQQFAIAEREKENLRDMKESTIFLKAAIYQRKLAVPLPDIAFPELQNLL